VHGDHGFAARLLRRSDLKELGNMSLDDMCAHEARHCGLLPRNRERCASR